MAWFVTPLFIELHILAVDFARGPIQANGGQVVVSAAIRATANFELHLGQVFAQPPIGRAEFPTG
jgi:hypothetical protein